MTFTCTCASCGGKFKTQPDGSDTCPRCRLIKAAGAFQVNYVQPKPRPKMTFFQEVRAFAATVVLFLAGCAVVLCLIGWIWQGLQVARLILGGG